MLTRFTVLGCASALLLALLPSSAIATHVSCGDVITQDTTLDSDLVNCPGDGVVIGASNTRSTSPATRSTALAAAPVVRAWPTLARTVSS